MLSPKETKKSTGNEKAVVVSSHYDSVVGRLAQMIMLLELD